MFAQAQAQTITVNTAVTYQTMVGWEAVEQACQVDCSNFATFADSLFDAAVEMGINRIRLEVLATATCSAATWDYTDLDAKINATITPMRTKLAAQGESLWVNLCYVDNRHCYGSNGGTRPLSEYVNRFRLAAQHIQSTFGWLPDSYEIALEPEVISSTWTTSDMNSAIPLLETELISNASIADPYLIGPSTPSGSVSFNTYFDAMSTTNRTKLSELVYHRYDTVTASHITSRSASSGVPPAMLERGDADYSNHLHVDLKTIGVVAWEEYALAYINSVGFPNYQYFDIPNAGATTFAIASAAKFFRQYFKHVRRGAQRVDATSGSGTFDPVAFRNTNGKVVVIVKASGSGSFTVGGLPANTYGLFYTTNAEYNTVLSNQTIASGQTISTSIPAAGVLTIYALNGDSAPVSRTTTGKVTSSGKVVRQ